MGGFHTLVIIFGLCVREAKRLGTLRFNDGTRREHRLKGNLSTLLKVNSGGPYRSSEREIKFRRRLFTASVKREMKHFHVVVACSDSKEMYKKV